MTLQPRLDLVRVNSVPPFVDEELLSADQIQQPVLVPLAKISGEEITVAKRLPIHPS